MLFRTFRNRIYYAQATNLLRALSSRFMSSALIRNNADNDNGESEVSLSVGYKS